MACRIHRRSSSDFGTTWSSTGDCSSSTPAAGTVNGMVNGAVNATVHGAANRAVNGTSNRVVNGTYI